MGFSNAVKNLLTLPGGLVLEQGTYTTTSTETTGTITAQTTTQPEIVEVLMFGASSDADTGVICATDAGSNKLKLTFSASDDGKYWIVGKGA